MWSAKPHMFQQAAVTEAEMFKRFVDIAAQQHPLTADEFIKQETERAERDAQSAREQPQTFPRTGAGEQA